MKKKETEQYLILPEAEIISLFFSGYSIERLTKFVKTRELCTAAEARKKVEGTITKYYCGLGKKEDG